MLLRILGFSFSLSEENKKELKRLLIVIDYLRMPGSVAETVVKVFNDVHYIEIEYWMEGVVYFGFFVMKVFVEERSAKKNSKLGDQEMTIRSNNFELQ